MSTKRVLITGFGDFPKVEDNPSWKSVEYMNRDLIESTYNIHFYPEKIDVTYKSVDESVPKLWAKLQPDLTIHVGVAEGISCFLLETEANREKYEIPDNDNCCPDECRHFCDGPPTITTDLDVDNLCEEFNKHEDDLMAQKSSDAGKFLCEYTYYTSLACRGCAKTLFVHVPLEGLAIDRIAQGLERILKICLAQLGD